QMEGLLRRVSATEMTYTGPGTIRRTWSVTWIAPDATHAPETARFWVAAMAANGNHAMNGPDAAGERGDRFVTARFEVAPSEATTKAWAERPLEPPVLEPFGPIIPAHGTVRLVNGHVPEDADGAEWRLDQADWRPAIGAPGFFFDLGPVEPGPHRLEARTILGNRTSEPTVLDFRAEEAGSGSAKATAPSGRPIAVGVMIVAVLALLAPLLWKLGK
ncbi:MAG TPA: hypothetical protein VI818_08185, partial [Candidatus Thermoplasmatota archaeon]|nr:hypothetical protein [Candidatus Thermoplasmatota archaeon]